jgi:hypothetical protein
MSLTLHNGRCDEGERGARLTGAVDGTQSEILPVLAPRHRSATGIPSTMRESYRQSQRLANPTRLSSIAMRLLAVRRRMAGC